MNIVERDNLGWLIRKLETIDQVSDDERRAIEGLRFTKKKIEAGQDIIQERNQATQSCLILQGWACRYKLLAEGKRQIMSFHIPGDIPDLQSLHLGVMDHNLAALTPCVVALIHHEGILDLTRRFPGIAGLLWRETLVDAAIFREWITGIGRRTAFGRISHLLCEIYTKLNAIGLADNHRCEWPITQIDIADALGLSNVHVNRVLQDLRARKLISLRGRTLVIENWDGLVEAAEFDPLYLHLKG